MKAGEPKTESAFPTRSHELRTPGTLVGPDRAEVGDSEDWPGWSGKSPPLIFCPGDRVLFLV